MKIRSQLRIALSIFGIMLVVISIFTLITIWRVDALRGQERLANNIAQDANDLSYLSGEFIVHQESHYLDRWQSKFDSFSRDLEGINFDNIQAQELINELKNNQQRMKEVFGGISSSIASPTQSQDPTLKDVQFFWSSMSIQTQSLVSDASSLSLLLHNEVEHVNLNTFLLISAFIITFCAFLVTIYVQTFRRTLRSISKLQEGTAIIGSGNLDHKVEIERDDEVGDLSSSFNKMTSKLKSVTASKTDLENEILERKKAEQEIKRSEMRYRNLFSNMTEGFGLHEIILDENGKPSDYRFLEINKAFERLTGISREQALGKTVKEVLPDVEQYWIDNYGKVALSGEPAHFENYSAPLGRWYDTYAYSPTEKQFAVVFMDVTKRKMDEEELRQARNSAQKRAEELEYLQAKLEAKAAEVEEYATRMEELAEERLVRLRDAERLAAIGATAGMVGHDIRNPLQAITGDVYLAKSDLASLPDGEEKEGIKESLDSIGSNVEYINKIVQDLQDFARPVKPVLQQMDLEAICQDIVFKEGTIDNIKTKLKIEEDARTLVSDDSLMRRILTNLFTNAVQAMPEGGKLEVKAKKKEKKIVIQVKDTGLGIPKEAKEKLFTPLFTTKSKGQGFGLAVVKRLTEALGGTITFESIKGKGTTFTIELPQCDTDGKKPR